MLGIKDDEKHIDVVKKIVRLYQSVYPNLYKLACIAFILPMSTANCKRGFSALNRIKTTLRNRLNETTLKHFFFIALEGPPATMFDFDMAADLWARKQNRRLSIIQINEE